jgi:hypothetical protein
VDDLWGLFPAAAIDMRLNARQDSVGKQIFPLPTNAWGASKRHSPRGEKSPPCGGLFRLFYGCW